MIIIIDGYNVLKTVHATSHISDHKREQFITQLIHYAHTSHNNIFIIFDGGEGLRPTFYTRNGVTIVYAGYHDSADDVIKHLIDREQHRDVMLVSSDRELNHYAANVDVPSIDSTVFYGHIEERLQTLQQVANQPKIDVMVRKRPGHESSPEVDALMEEGSEKVFYKYEDKHEKNLRDKYHTKPSNRLNKEEKKLSKIVKKL
jgi:predicted RNA-binding protein with PIN domain